ncbi:MAG: cyclase family protein [Candidatus Helarchaeales archaeon]
MEKKTFHDISIYLGIESAVYPGDPEFDLEYVQDINKGDPFFLSKITTSSHVGTHVDFPLHFIPGGNSSENYSLDRFILPAEVVQVSEKDSIQKADVSNIDFDQVEAILFKTRNSLSGLSTSGRFTESYVALSLEAAEFCIENGIKLVGIDYISIEQFGTTRYPVHVKLLENDVLILEGLNLAGVIPGRYLLICLPLKVKGAEAVPARAILMER